MGLEPAHNAAAVPSAVCGKSINEGFPHCITVMALINEVVRQFDAVFFRKRDRTASQQRTTNGMLRRIVLANELGQRHRPHVAHVEALVDVDPGGHSQFFMRTGGQFVALPARQSRGKRLRRPSSEQNVASCHRLAPGTRVFMAGREESPKVFATLSAAEVAFSTLSKSVFIAGSDIVGAWITYRAASFPALVAIASPTLIGALWSASLSIVGPPALLMAPATPPPIISLLFAGFTTASA